MTYTLNFIPLEVKVIIVVVFQKKDYLSLNDIKLHSIKSRGRPLFEWQTLVTSKSKSDLV